MLCPKCKTEIPDIAIYCHKCGEPIQKLPDVKTSIQKSKETHNNKIVILSIISSVIVIMGCIIYAVIAIKTYTKKTSLSHLTTDSPYVEHMDDIIEPHINVLEKNTSVKILDITESDHIGPTFNQELSKGKFVIVTISIENNENSTFIFKPDNCKIIDDNGNNYVASNENYSVLLLMEQQHCDHKLSTGIITKIPPKNKAHFHLPFDVPENTNTNNLRLYIRSNKNSQFIEITKRNKANS